MDHNLRSHRSKQDYVYSPLEGPNWIRALQLSPAHSHSEPLRCRIIHLDRSRLAMSSDKDLNYYSAVSYVWGNPIFSQDLVVEASGQNNSILKITPNVDAMLRRFRKSIKPLNLWIDAVCLDQGNEIEMSQQLPLMGEIYCQAKKVRVWMGEEDENIAEVFRFFRALAKIDEDLFREKRLAKTNKAIQHIVLESFPSRSVASIERFFQRAWFTRRWVVQELALSTVATIYCHDEQISWPLLTKALQNFKLARNFYQHSHVFRLDQMALNALGVAISLTMPRKSILQNLWGYHESACSNPADRLLAFIGFSKQKGVSESTIANLLTDRSSTERILSSFAEKCVSAGHLGEIIHHAIAFGSLNVSEQRFASWCPDWTRSRMRFESMLEPANMSWTLGMEDNPSRMQDSWKGTIGLSADRKGIFMRQKAATVLDTTEDWTGPLTWTGVSDALHRLLPMPKIKQYERKCCFSLGGIVCEILYASKSRLFNLTTTMTRLKIAKYLGMLLVCSNSSTTEHMPYELRNIPSDDLETIKQNGLQEVIKVLDAHSIFSVSFRMKPPRRKAITVVGLGLGLRGMRRGDIVLCPHLEIFRSYDNPSSQNPSRIKTTPVLRPVLIRDFQKKKSVYHDIHRAFGTFRWFRHDSFKDTKRTTDLSDETGDDAPPNAQLLTDLDGWILVHSPQGGKSQGDVTLDLSKGPTDDEMDWMKVAYGQWGSRSLYTCYLQGLASLVPICLMTWDSVGSWGGNPEDYTSIILI